MKLIVHSLQQGRGGRIRICIFSWGSRQRSHRVSCSIFRNIKTDFLEVYWQLQQGHLSNIKWLYQILIIRVLCRKKEMRNRFLGWYFLTASYLIFLGILIWAIEFHYKKYSQWLHDIVFIFHYSIQHDKAYGYTFYNNLFRIYRE